jgi:hypothetical protein
VVIGDGAKKHGLTGDYLTVGLVDARVARGARFAAVLTEDGDGVAARPRAVD